MLLNTLMNASSFTADAIWITDHMQKSKQRIVDLQYGGLIFLCLRSCSIFLLINTGCSIVLILLLRSRICWYLIFEGKVHSHDAAVIILTISRARWKALNGFGNGRLTFVWHSCTSPSEAYFGRSVMEFLCYLLFLIRSLQQIKSKHGSRRSRSLILR